MFTELLLYYIIKKAGIFGKLKTSTAKISKDLNVSQQTISRKLRELEDLGIIKRIVSPVGVIVSLNKKGILIVKKRYSLLKKAFEKKVPLSGVVKSGIGEGAYYVKIYSKKFKNKLGFMPFLGTLNLKIDPVKSKEFILNSEEIFIEEFSDDKRTFGGVHCCKVKINDKIDGALILPVRARHPEDIIEIIASICLREHFKLKDGDKVKIKHK